MKKMNNMAAKIDFPIGSPLRGVAVSEDKTFETDELCFDQVQLFFDQTVITLQAAADTDELDITQQPLRSGIPRNSSPSWCKSLVGNTLETVWICHNTQHYQDQVIFAFRWLHPALVFLAEGSVIKVFRCEQIMRKTPQPKIRSRTTRKRMLEIHS